MKQIGRPAQLQIEECQPLIARFRLTLDRELYSIKMKVYVEASNDVKFYHYYYSLLYQLCEEERIKNKRIKSRNLFSNNRLLSRRYQLNFFSVDKKEDKNSTSNGGGSAQVCLSVQRDVNYFDKLKLKHEMINQKVYKPFGIIDMDYKNRAKEDKLAANPSMKERIVYLKRYAIENSINLTQNYVIPVDLAETLFTLNGWAQKQVNEIYKPVTVLSDQLTASSIQNLE